MIPVHCFVSLPPGLGMAGGFERLHFLLEGFFDEEGCLNPSFAKVREGLPQPRLRRYLGSRSI